MSNSFLRYIMKEIGYSEYEIEDAISKIDDNPNEYIILLKSMEDIIEFNRLNKKKTGENY